MIIHQNKIVNKIFIIPQNKAPKIKGIPRFVDIKSPNPKEHRTASAHNNIHQRPKIIITVFLFINATPFEVKNNGFSYFCSLIPKNQSVFFIG